MSAPPFRDWRARPHPDAVVPVTAGRRVSRATVPGRAVLVVTTAWRGKHSREWRPLPDLRPARPLTPVVRVDGHPVSWGWGETRVELDPGPHLVTVHSSHTRHYLRVVVEGGELRILRYGDILGAAAHRATEWGRVPYDRSSFGEERRLPAAVPAAGLVPLAVMLGLVVFTPSPQALVRAAMWTAIATGLTVAAVAIVGALRRPRTPVVPEGRSVVLPAARAGVPKPGRFTGGLELWLRAELEPLPPEERAALAGGAETPWQRWRVARLGEPVPPPYRFWLPSPEVTLDGVPIASDWVRTWRELAPGEHEITVTLRVPGQKPVPVVRTVGVENGRTTAVTLTAHVLAVPHPLEARLSRFTASWR